MSPTHAAWTLRRPAAAPQVTIQGKRVVLAVGPMMGFQSHRVWVVVEAKEMHPLERTVGLVLEPKVPTFKKWLS